jgi:uncharacterized protein (TIGR00730 family)
MAEKVAPGLFSDRNFRAGRVYASTEDARERMGHADHGLLEGGSDPAFLHTDPWRALRILSEFVDGFDALARCGRAVSVFGSARLVEGSPQYELARSVGAAAARAGLTVITGGGPGLMEAANAGAVDGQIESKSRSFGLAIHLPTEESANPFVDKVFRHRTFFSRLHHFIRLSSAFIVMPGGIGTALELFMVWQLLQVKHMKEHPLILVGTMWPGLIDWMRATMIERGLVGPSDFDVINVVGSGNDAVPIIRESYERWLEQEKANANAGAGARGAEEG